MYDRYKREINYLRISVTDRCNLRCRYCMPEEGVRLLRHEDILTFDEIVKFTESAVSMGIWKVRITGGEPLVRKGITELVGMLAGIKGIKDLSMSTNGTLLKNFAGELRKAGLQRVNISLDTTDPEQFAYITRGGNVADVIEGISAAKKAGLLPVKINCVVRESREEEDAKLVREFCARNNLEIRYIHQMDLVSGHFTTVEGGSGGNCPLCNRLRLTSNGMLKPCLFSDIGFNIREISYREAIEKAVEMKPASGMVNHKDNFYNIGG
ncbi:MAG: radical SAM protein [Bacteroidales bacterium]|nr:radical SAM protein [Bacteroidales bacterium]